MDCLEVLETGLLYPGRRSLGTEASVGRLAVVGVAPARIWPIRDEFREGEELQPCPVVGVAPARTWPTRDEFREGEELQPCRAGDPEEEVCAWSRSWAPSASLRGYVPASRAAFSLICGARCHVLHIADLIKNCSRCEGYAGAPADFIRPVRETRPSQKRGAQYLTPPWKGRTEPSYFRVLGRRRKTAWAIGGGAPMVSVGKRLPLHVAWAYVRGVGAPDDGAGKRRRVW